MLSDGTKRVVVIGAGPAGMMAAVTAAQNGASVTVLERNSFAGKKLRITGKGRCNLTNDCSPREVMEAVRRNPKFLYGVLNRFSPADVMAKFEEWGVPLKTERGRRVFPQSDKAADVQAAMVRAMRDAGVTVVYDARVTEIRVLPDSGYAVHTRQKAYEADGVILASGGVSYPGTGSTGDGHRMLAEMGVTVTPLSPSLVPVETRENFAPLSGLTLKNVTLTVTRDGKTVFTEMGEMLFTHFGVSGPLVLSASANMQEGNVADYAMAVNLKPALDGETLDKRVLRDLGTYAARDLGNALTDLLPGKLIPTVIGAAGLDPHKKAASVTKEERARLCGVLSAFPVTPTAFRKMDEAIVTAGGVDVSEISPKTMELKGFPGLYVAGELIDIDAYTGGYNLQLAFSTGYAAGMAAAEW